MAKNALETLIETAAAATGPMAVDEPRAEGSSIDPCGLRETNFDMMNEVCDGLNNVARHIRPFTLVAWAWRRALRIAEQRGAALNDVEEIEEFVARCETVFAWSCFLDDRNADIPGAQALAPFLSQGSYRFSGSHWESFRKIRRNSTGFSAPANYGPGLRSLGWTLRNAANARALVPSPDAAAAIDAFEARLGDRLSHPVFSTFGEAEVTTEDVSAWAAAWKLDALTYEERVHMRRALTGDLATRTRAEGVGLLLSAAGQLAHCEPAGAEGVISVRNAAAGEVAEFAVPEGFGAAAVKWRRLQVRQLFRFALEALLAWTLDRLSDGPRGSEQLATVFLREADIDPTENAGTAWLGATSPPGSLSQASDSIADALRVRGRAGLGAAIARALAICIANAPEEGSSYDREDRLPLRRAAQQAIARASMPSRELARHVIETWVLAQHVYWAVGRGLQDARGSGKRILRLKVVMEEGGWQALPGARLSPEPTPDRIRTALKLAEEAQLINLPIGFAVSDVR